MIKFFDWVEALKSLPSIKEVLEAVDATITYLEILARLFGKPTWADDFLATVKAFREKLRPLFGAEPGTVGAYEGLNDETKRAVDAAVEEVKAAVPE